MNSPKPVKRTPPRMLQVKRTEYVSDAMLRVTLSGPELVGFPTDKNGAHIKIFLPRPGQDRPVLPTLGPKGPIWPEAHERPITRTYSVRRYCPVANELDVDFVMHDSTADDSDPSPAAGWAAKARPGDCLGVAGPGGPDPLLAPAAQHLLVGDLTALPAISALLEAMPADAQGQVLIELDDYAHRQPISHPNDMPVQWILRAPRGSSSHGVQSENPLLNALKRWRLPLPGQTLSAFVAGENGLVLGVRDYLRQTYGLRKQNLYAVPYWRRGQHEEAYHQERHRIMDEVY